MIIIYIICAVSIIASFLADRNRTKKALKIAAKKIINILPAFTIMLIIVSVLLYFIDEEMIIKYISEENSFLNILLAAAAGSVSMMPGFIAYPLCGILRNTGVSISVIAAFATSLMLVGIISFPVEKYYLGMKTAVLRNLIAFILSILIALVIGFLYGEFLF